MLPSEPLLHQDMVLAVMQRLSQYATLRMADGWSPGAKALETRLQELHMAARDIVAMVQRGGIDGLDARAN